jgi:hypothetical protein
MRKALMLASVVVLAGVGAGAAAASLLDIYVVTVKISTANSGGRNHPKAIASSIAWDVGSSPPGQRPAVVSHYTIFFQGIREHTTLFRGCGSSTLSMPGATPTSCPRASRIGFGYLIFELGGSGQSNESYGATCSSSLAVFNGGFHDLTLFFYKGKQRPDRPVQCTIPGGHVAVTVNISRSRRGITESFDLPQQLSHPVPGLDAAVIHGFIQVHARTRHRRGLFESVSCPRSHQRQVVMTFTREDGVSSTVSVLVPCR